MFLLDTNVLSALRQRSADFLLERGVVGEVVRGIERQRRCDPVHAQALAAWLDRVLALYGERILAVDLPAARQ